MADWASRPERPQHRSAYAQAGVREGRPGGHLPSVGPDVDGSGLCAVTRRPRRSSEIESGSEPSSEAPERARVLQRTSDIAGFVNLAAGAAIIGVTAVLATKSGRSFKWSFVSRFLPSSPTPRMTGGHAATQVFAREPPAELLRLLEIVGATCRREAREQRLSVIAGMNPPVEEGDDAGVLSGADEPPEPLLQSDGRARHVIVENGFFPAARSPTSAR